MAMVTRGDIWLACLDPTVGSEIQRSFTHRYDTYPAPPRKNSKYPVRPSPQANVSESEQPYSG